MSKVWFARMVMALLRESSHCRLVEPRGGPGALLVLCLLLLLEGVGAAVPTWAVMSSAAGTTWTEIGVNTCRVCEEALGDAADIRWAVTACHGSGRLGPQFNRANCSSANNISTWEQNPFLEEALAPCVGRTAVQHHGSVATWTANGTATDSAQNSFKEALGDAADIRWGAAARWVAIYDNQGDDAKIGCHFIGDDGTAFRENFPNATGKSPTKTTPGNPAGCGRRDLRGRNASNAACDSGCQDYVDFTQEPTGDPTGIRGAAIALGHEGNTDSVSNYALRIEIFNKITTGEQNPYKEASGGAAGIKKVSYPTTITSTPPLPAFSNINCTPVSAIGASAATFTLTVSTANPGQNLRRQLCSSLLTRETMTLSSRNWRPLETS